MPSSTVTERPVAHNLGRRTHKVLHVINGEVYGGAERALDLLALELPALGFQVAFACLKPALFPKVRRARQARLYKLPMRGRFDLRPVRALVRIIRRQGYSLIYAHTARSVMVASLASKITGVPLVYHVQSPTSRDTTNKWKNRINGLVERLSLGRVSALMPVSESLGEHVRRQGFSEELISVVPNGSPCRESVPRRDESKTDWTLGITALIRPRKGIEILLRALAILNSQGLPVRLRVVGPFETSQYERKVKTLTEKLGLSKLVDWVGYTGDINSELARMDLFVLPSLFGEGTPPGSAGGHGRRRAGGYHARGGQPGVDP